MELSAHNIYSNSMMPCLVFLCVPLMHSLLPAFRAKLPIFQFTVHLYTVYLTLLSGWRRKWLLSYCRALTTRSRGTVFWQPGCAHTKMTLSSPMRTSYSSCQVRSRLFVWFGFQVASHPDPSETLQRYQLAAGTYFSASDGCRLFSETWDQLCWSTLVYVTLIRNWVVYLTYFIAARLTSTHIMQNFTNSLCC